LPAMRIGLFGGTFNPIHSGHLTVAQKIKEAFALECIFIIPSAFPPHKKAADIADAKDRLEMIRLAVSDYRHFIISDAELKRPGTSYTIDTIKHFKAVSPDKTEFYFILGLDAFFEIDTWKSYRDFFDFIPFIIVTRSGEWGNGSSGMRKILEDYIKTRIADGYTFSSSRSCYVHKNKHPIFIFDIKPIDISSTKIRERVKKGRSIKSLVPEKVEHFIKTKGLYL
jgi:nicotinate-nucleotide adenylyltransferase